MLYPTIQGKAFAKLEKHAHIRFALEMLFDGHGYRVFSGPDPASVLAALQGQTFDLVLIDLNYTRDSTGGAEGLELVWRIRSSPTRLIFHCKPIFSVLSPTLTHHKGT
jgi:CheY-like chemotaxis protein